MSIKSRMSLRVLLVACFLSAATAAFAQGTNLGTIRGTVTDPQGAAVPSAQVQVTDLVTNITSDLTTNNEGSYEAPNLKFGTYRVTIAGQGFKTAVINDVNVRGSDVVRADAQLEVGGAAEEITVQADAGVIQTETATIASSIENRQLTQLPRESRDIYSFLFLNPNITQGPSDFKFIGAQSYGASFSLDGQRANGGIFGGATASQPSLEVISELTVLSNNFTAEYSGIANIRVVTKRGGKDYHGSLFYNNRNSALAAWSVQDKIAQANFSPTPALAAFPNPYFNLNETGGSFSGPVPFTRGKTFFLTSYERRWDYAPVTVRSSNIPTSKILGGDFRVLAEASRPAVPAEVLPLLTAQELANNTFLTGTTRRFNVIPERLLNPIALNIVRTYYPQTGDAPFNPLNGRLVDFYQNMSGLLTRDLFTFRADHDFSERDKFYAVYNFQAREGIRTLVANPLPGFGLLDQTGRNHTLSLSYTRLFSDTVVNELRGGFNIQKLYRRSPRTTRDFLTGVGFNEQEISSYGAIVGESLLDKPGHVAFTLGSFQGIGSGARNISRSFDQNLMTFGDTLTWVTGKHSIKAGADFVRNQAIDEFVTNRNDPRGTIVYPNNFAGFARFLIGLPPSQVRYVFNVRPPMDVYNWESGFYVQDEYRVHPRVTLNLGLRYELITPFVDENDLMINFDPNGTGNNGLKGRFIVPSADIIPSLHPAFIQQGVVTADEAGVGRGLVKTDRNNLAPRLGIAWRVTDNTVLRGGYGIFYPTSAAQGQRDAFGSSTFNQRITKNSTAAAPLGGLPGGINPRGITPFSGGTFAVQGISVNAIPVDLQSPRIEQFNATIEHELGWRTGVRLSYLGSRMHNLIGGEDLNLLQPSDVPFGTTTGDGITPCVPDNFNCQESPADRARRRFPQFGAYLASYGNFGNARSHAMQIEVNRRFAAGLTFNVSYTLLDQKGSGFDVGASSLGGTSYNQFNPEGDYARDSFVSRHRLVAYGVYDLPFGRGRKFGGDIPRALDLAAGGWQLSWNMFAKSGTGFTPWFSCSNCDPAYPGNIGSSFIDPIGGFEATGFRANIVSDADLYLRQGDQFFNPAAFTVPSVGADVLDNPAVAKRNILTGPGTWGANLGLRKFFRFSEQTSLEIGADFNNIFNHPLRSPLSLYNFSRVGEFFIDVDPATRRVLPITRIVHNPRFGRTNETFAQEGIESRRLIRLRLRLTF